MVGEGEESSLGRDASPGPTLRGAPDPESVPQIAGARRTGNCPNMATPIAGGPAGSCASSGVAPTEGSLGVLE